MKTVDWKKHAKYALLILAFGVLAVNYLNTTGAKFKTESDVVSDQARVAKWITGTTIDLDLFNDSYLADDPALEGRDSVKSADGGNLIAPGTSATYTFAPALEGNAPEVAYQFKFSTAGEYAGDWTTESGAYEPISFTLTQVDGENEQALVEDVSLTELIGALNTAGAATTYEPNTLPSDTSYRISWSWPFSVDEATDLKDTTLAGKLSASISVEQLN